MHISGLLPTILLYFRKKLKDTSIELSLSPCTEYKVRVDVLHEPKANIWTETGYKTPCGCTDPFRYAAHVQNILEFTGIIQEYSGIYWNTLEFIGILWNLLEFTGIFWNLLEYSGIYGNLIHSLKAPMIPLQVLDVKI